MESSGIFEGQYCLVSWAPSKTMMQKIQVGLDPSSKNSVSIMNSTINELQISHGICLPATCSSQKILEFLNSATPGEIEATSATCIDKNPIPLDKVDIAAM